MNAWERCGAALDASSVVCVAFGFIASGCLSVCSSAWALSVFLSVSASQSLICLNLRVFVCAASVSLLQFVCRFSWGFRGKTIVFFGFPLVL